MRRRRLAKPLASPTAGRAPGLEKEEVHACHLLLFLLQSLVRYLHLVLVIDHSNRAQGEAEERLLHAAAPV